MFIHAHASCKLMWITRACRLAERWASCQLWACWYEQHVLIVKVHTHLKPCSHSGNTTSISPCWLYSGLWVGARDVWVPRSHSPLSIKPGWRLPSGQSALRALSPSRTLMQVHLYCDVPLPFSTKTGKREDTLLPEWSAATVFYSEGLNKGSVPAGCPDEVFTGVPWSPWYLWTP